jgi:RimJ/RimL family protein N-acetyltransferase
VVAPEPFTPRARVTDKQFSVLAADPVLLASLGGPSDRYLNCGVLLGRASVTGVDGVLREVVDSDLDAFFEHQREPEANRMAACPARDREAFDAHWRRLLADDSLTKKTIVYEGEVAGNVGCWEQEGRRFVGYWIGREFWGKGLATRALQELTGEVTQRPLHAWVATSNLASIRVLEKCGFVRVGSHKNDVEELLFELCDGGARLPRGGL